MIGIPRKYLILLFSFCVIINAKAQEPRAIAQTDAECFITKWAMNAGVEFTLPTTGGGYDFIINWGDGSPLEALTGSGPFTHTYATTGTFTLKISGTFPQIYCNDYYYTSKDNNENPNAIRLLSIDQWGPIVWRSMEKAFSGCAKMRVRATDTPNLSQVTTMESMFNGCTIMNDPVANWDVSSVTNMRYLFFEAKAFNQPVNNWVMDNVTNTEEMFYYCSKFNQPLDKWNVSNVTNMSDMFYRCGVFNQNIGGWDVSNVTDMNRMFYYCRKFNQDIGSWQVGKVTSFRMMFYYATEFNQDLGNWDTRSATSMQSMFHRATKFDQDLSAWQIPKLTNAQAMFNYVTLSIANYDALLISWAKQVEEGKTSSSMRYFHGGDSKYCQGEAARTFLIENGWESNRNQGDIIDGGKVSANTANITINALGVFQGEAGNIELLHTEDGVEYYATATPESLNSNRVIGSATKAINLITPSLNTTTEFTLWADNNTCAASFNQTASINVYPKGDIENSAVMLVTEGANNPIADGASEHRIRVTAYDINGNLLPNAGVKFMPVEGIVAGTDSLITDANGEAIFTLTSELAGTYNSSFRLFTKNPDKNLTKNWGEISTKVAYTFDASIPVATNSIVELITDDSYIVANGSSRHILKATLKDAQGNPVPNYGVTFGATTANSEVDKVTFTSLNGDVFAPGEATTGLVTNAKGELIVFATSTKAWVDFTTGVTFNNGTDDIAFINGNITYSFVAGGPYFENSTITASPTSATVGTDIDLTIIILDENNNPCRGFEVIALQAHLGSIATDLVSYNGVVGDASGVVDANGQFIVKATSNVVGTYTSKGTILVEGVPGVQSKTVAYSFTPGEPDTNNSYVKLSINNAEANGTNRNWLSVFAFDEYGNIAPGKNVQIAATPNVNWGSGYNTAHTAISNSNGVAEFTAVSAVAGTYSSEVKIEVGGTYQAISSQTGYESPRVNPVVYTFLPGAPNVSNSQITLENSPAIADGVDAAVIKVEIRDDADNAVSDAVVVFQKTENISGTLRRGTVHVAEGISPTGHDADGNLYLVTDAEGIIEIAGVSTVAGRYTTNVTLEKNTDGVFPVIARARYVFNPGLADAEKSKVTLLVANSTVGEENKLRVELFDANNNRVGSYDAEGNFTTAIREAKEITFSATSNVSINNATTGASYVHTLGIGDASVFDIPLSSTVASTYSTQVLLKMLDENNAEVQKPISGGNPLEYTFVADGVSLEQSSVEVTKDGSSLAESNQLKVSIRDSYGNPIGGVLIHLNATPGVNFGRGIGIENITTTQQNGDALINISSIEAGLYKTIITYSVDGSFPENQQITNGGKPATYYFTDAHTIVNQATGLAVRAKWFLIDYQEKDNLTELDVFNLAGAKAWDFKNGQSYTNESSEFSMAGFASLKNAVGVGANNLSFTLEVGGSSLVKEKVVASFIDDNTEWDEANELAIYAVDYALSEAKIVENYNEVHAKIDGKTTAWSLSNWDKNDLLSQISVGDLTNIVQGTAGRYPLSFTVSDESKTLSNSVLVTVFDDEEWFITTWQTTTENESITIPTIGSGYDFAVDWGDGSHIEEFAGEVTATHEYTTPGTHIVRISGVFPRIYFDNGNSGQDILKILSIEQWGSIEWASMENAFKGCSNLTIGDTVTSVPKLSGVTNIENMFRGCEKINSPSIVNWDVSTIENMAGTFQGALSFNQDVSGWNVANVNSMARMFQDAIVFNQDLSSWGAKTSKVQDMSYLFRHASLFDQNLASWNISALSNAIHMFSYSGLSQENYDALLMGWNTQVEAGNNNNAVPFSAIGIRYCEGKEARTNLIAKGWGESGTINDGGELCPNPFTTTWNILSAGETITIPTTGEGYDFTIDWGDGTIDSFTDGDTFSHQYTDAGTYSIKIYPNIDLDGDGISKTGFPQIYFNNGEEKNKIVSVDNWGDIIWSSMQSAFYGCSNLQINATDAPNLSELDDLSNMFRNCTALNADLSHWNVSYVEKMTGMFFGATSFNQSLGAWEITSLADAARMLDNSGMLVKNYDELLQAWNEQVVNGLRRNTNSVLFSAVGVGYCAGAEARTSLIENGWGDGVPGDQSGNLTDIEDGGEACPKPFITTWKTTTANETITIPVTGTGYDYTVDWGVVDAEGNPIITTHVNDAGSYTYPDAGTYTIKITHNKDTDGDGFADEGFYRITFEDDEFADQRAKIQTVEQWGNTKWLSMVGAFDGCLNLQVNATDAPDLSLVSTMERMFHNCSTLNSNINHWNVSNITSMRRMFQGATSFNQSLNDWDVSRVENMEYMFELATSFNGNIADWKTTSLQKVIAMFRNASSFNISIGEWDMSDVEDMSEMFRGASVFNQSLNNWNVGNVKSMENMFRDASKFNGELSDWNTENVTSMKEMFRGASVFNRPINYNETTGAWNVAKVNNMQAMFLGASKFNENIEDWDISKVNDVRNMFNSAVEFNQPLAKWGTKLNVSSLFGVFSNAYAFNQDLSSWNVGTVKDMSFTFNNARAFDQDLSSWNIPALEKAPNMLDKTALSVTNYDRLLVSWAEQVQSSLYDPNVTNLLGITFSAVDVNYCMGESAREYLILAGWGDAILEDQSGTNDDIKDGQKSCGKLFITTWQVEAGETVAIPSMSNKSSGEYYNYIIDWGDGSSELIKSTDANGDGIYDLTVPSHTYSNTATEIYTIKIKGILPHLYFSAREEAFGGDAELYNKVVNSRNQILTIEKWGDIEWSSMEYSFMNCRNLHSIRDEEAPNLSAVSSTEGMFGICSALENASSISNWDMSGVKNTFQMFYFASKFNEDLSSWDISSLENASNMLDYCGMSTENYDKLLIEWNKQVQAGTANQNVEFGASELKYCQGDEARVQLINKGWGDGQAGDQSGILNDIIDAGYAGTCEFTINFQDEYHNKTITPATPHTKKYQELTSVYELPSLGEFNHDEHQAWSQFLHPGNKNGVNENTLTNGSDVKALVDSEFFTQRKLPLYAVWSGDGVGEPNVSINDICEIHYLKEESSIELYGKAYINSTEKTYLMNISEPGKLFKRWTTGNEIKDATIFGQDPNGWFLKAETVADDELKLHPIWHIVDGDVDCEYYTITYLTENGTVYEFDNDAGVIYYYQARQATNLPNNNAGKGWSLIEGGNGEPFTINRFTQGNLILYPISE